MFRRFIGCTSGATAIEYSLIAAGIALAVFAAINNVGGNVQGKYDNMAANVNDALD